MLPEQELLVAERFLQETKPRRRVLGRLRPELAPTEQATSKDFYWAAGFYEGEGWCGMHRQNSQRARSMIVIIGQKDTWVLERMRALFGGTVGGPSSRDCSVWRVTGARARGFIWSIYGLLSPRRQEQIRKASGVGEFSE